MYCKVKTESNFTSYFICGPILVLINFSPYSNHLEQRVLPALSVSTILYGQKPFLLFFKAKDVGFFFFWITHVIPKGDALNVVHRIQCSNLKASLVDGIYYSIYQIYNGFFALLFIAY